MGSGTFARMYDGGFLVAAFGQRVNVIGDSMSPVLKKTEML